MNHQTLYLKDSKTEGENIELYFHKEYTHIFNPEEFPVTRIRLIKCKSLRDFDPREIDHYNDGVTADVASRGGVNIFTTTDMGGRTVVVECEKVEIMELVYSNDDLRHIISELKVQLDLNYSALQQKNDILNNTELFIKREIDNVSRKLHEAGWLTEKKVKYLEGQILAYNEVLSRLNN